MLDPFGRPVQFRFALQFPAFRVNKLCHSCQKNELVAAKAGLLTVRSPGR